MSGNEKADLSSTAIFAQRRTTMGQKLSVSDLWRKAGPLRKETVAVMLGELMTDLALRLRAPHSGHSEGVFLG